MAGTSPWRVPADRVPGLGPPPAPAAGDAGPDHCEVIRASKTIAVRHENDHSGELIHMAAKKIGKIPAGSGWRVHSR